MSEEEPFRTILVVAGLILLPIAAYFRIRSQSTGEPLDRRQEGLFILLTLRPVGVITALTFLAYLINPAWMEWSAVAVPRAWRWVGIGVGVLGGALWIWAFRNLGKNLTDTVVTRREHTLVTTGPYRWVRHPFYVAVALTVLANSLAAANWFLFLGGAVTLTLIGIRTRREEELLVARFGDAYRDYMRRTGRFFPRVGQGVGLVGVVLFAVALPFTSVAAPTAAPVRICEPSETGKKLVFGGRVLDMNGRPLAKASVVAYHTDARGYYNPPNSSTRVPRLRAVAITADDGSFRFETIRPGAYPDGAAPAHIHMIVTAPAHHVRYLEYWFTDDPLVTKERRRQVSGDENIVIVEPRAGSDGVAFFEHDIGLKGN